MKLPFAVQDDAKTIHSRSESIQTPKHSELPNHLEADQPKQDLRRQRFTRPLKHAGVKAEIPSSWDYLPPVDVNQHESAFLEILTKAGLSTNSPVPLVARYSKPRPWSAEELEACVRAHENQIPVALMSAALNRNPQDIIYRLLDACHASDSEFREVGLGVARWTPKIKAVARDLFDAGLTAWRIGALFGVDFEGIEKALYAGRTDYGHSKRNPFAICSDHKQELNREVLQGIKNNPQVLDAFAGEGRFAAIVADLFPSARQVCIEQNPETFARAQEMRTWGERTQWILDNNIKVMKQLGAAEERFDIVDLDPFVSCRDQIDVTWPLLKDQGLLFVTFGGEYRRSFIRTNRKAIGRRYGFYDSSISNSDYLEIVPSFFLGWLSSQASEHQFVFEIECCVRYPNNCRFWLRVKREAGIACRRWLGEHTRLELNGIRWRDLSIPRFSELRKKVARKTRDKNIGRLAEDQNTCLPSSTKTDATDVDQFLLDF